MKRLSIVLLLMFSASLSAQEPRKVPALQAFPRALVEAIWAQTVWNDGNHNGFPGIAQVGGYYYVAFRSAASHQAKESKIVVVRAAATDLKKWDKVATFQRDHEARDPLVFDNRGQVQLVFHSKEDFYSVSADGLKWSEPQELKTEFVQPQKDNPLTFTSERRWLFRIRQGPDGAFYSLGRCGIKEKGGRTFGLILYRSADGITFKAMHNYGEGPTSALPQAGGSGWGHEADIAWTPDGTLAAAIRNSGPGVVVLGPAPAGPWQAFTTGASDFGGPALHQTKKGGMLLAARAFTNDRKERLGFPAILRVWTVTAKGVEQPWTVPSGGDCAYSSFADAPEADGVLLVYYSSHEHPQLRGTGNNPANIYLAHIRLRHAPPKE